MRKKGFIKLLTLWNVATKILGSAHVFLLLYVLCSTVIVECFSTFFAIFEKLYVSVDQVYFLEVNLKKSANFAARAAKFLFFLNRRDFKYEYYFLKICRIFPYT